MTKKEVQLWDRYCKEIEKHNRPYRKALSELFIKESEKSDYYDESYKKDLEKWANRGWLYKLFYEKPKKYNYLKFANDKFDISFQIEKIIIFAKHMPMNDPTYEGFLNWRVKNKV